MHIHNSSPTSCLNLVNVKHLNGDIMTGMISVMHSLYVGVGMSYLLECDISYRLALF